MAPPVDGIKQGRHVAPKAAGAVRLLQLQDSYLLAKGFDLEWRRERGFLSSCGEEKKNKHTCGRLTYLIHNLALFADSLL